MKIQLKSEATLDQFTASNETGHSITLGNDGKLTGPMQAVLMAAAGCSTIDIIMILQKMKQGLTNIEVEVEGKRREEIPRTFTVIHLHYKLYGSIKKNKAEQAINSSLEKYCSVSLMLEKAATITSSFEIIES